MKELFTKKNKILPDIELDKLVLLKEEELEKKLAPLKTEILYVNFAKASELSSKIKPILSKRGSIITDSRTNSLIVTDIPENLKKCK